MATINTINGLITRINAAFNTIRAKAKNLELTIPAGTYWNGSNDSAISATTVGDSHKIDAVAAAINNITKRTFTDNKTTGSANAEGKTVSGSYTIQSGYYPSDVTVSYSASVSNIATGTAGNSTTKTAPLTATPGTYDKYTNTSGTKDGKLFKVNISASGYYTSGTDLYTNIPVYTDMVKEIPITILENTNDGLTYVTPTSLSNGYYSGASVKPVISTSTTNKVVNIYTNDADSATTITSQTGNLAVPANYDYQGARYYSVRDGAHAFTNTISAHNANTAYSVGAIVLSGSTVYRCIKAVAANANIPATDTTHWEAYTAGSEITSLYVADSITTSGWLGTSKKSYKVRSAAGSLSASLSSSATTYKPTITKHADTNVGASAATTDKPANGYYIAVSSAANSASITATASNSLTTAGWIGSAFANATKTATVGAAASDVTYIPITSGGHNLTNTTAFSTSATYAKDAYVYYNGKLYKCSTAVTTAGNWNASNWTEQSPTAISSQFITDTISAGYISSGTNYYKIRDYVAGTLTVNTTNGTSSLACNTAGWLGSAISFTIPTTDGRLGDGADLASANQTTTNKNANANIATSRGTVTASTTKLGDLTLNTTFYATDSGNASAHAPRFLSSFTVEVNDTIAALQAI